MWVSLTNWNTNEANRWRNYCFNYRCIKYMSLGDIDCILLQRDRHLLSAANLRRTTSNNSRRLN